MKQEDSKKYQFRQESKQTTNHSQEGAVRKCSNCVHSWDLVWYLSCKELGIKVKPDFRCIKFRRK